MGTRSATLEARLPVELVEIRPGRHVAVHHRPSSTSKPLPRIFFVHGSCASMLQFEELVSHFAAAGHEVVTYDFVGCGRSPKPRDWYAYAFAELRADLAAIIARYGPETEVRGGWPFAGPQVKKNLLVCHSAGCALALGIVAGSPTDPPATIDGLVLMGASFHPAGFQVPSLFYYPALLLGWMQPKLSAGFEALALHERTRSAATPARQQVLQLAQEVNASNPPYMFKAYYRQVVLPTADEVRAAGAKVPIALVVGDSDKLVPRTSTEALRALLPAETPIHEVGEASHQHMQEDPQACVAIIDGFLRSGRM